MTRISKKLFSPEAYKVGLIWMLPNARVRVGFVNLNAIFALWGLKSEKFSSCKFILRRNFSCHSMWFPSGSRLRSTCVMSATPFLDMYFETCSQTRCGKKCNVSSSFLVHHWTFNSRFDYNLSSIYFLIIMTMIYFLIIIFHQFI